MVKSDIYVSNLLRQLRMELKVNHLNDGDTLVIDRQRHHIRCDNSSESVSINVNVAGSNLDSVGLIIVSELPVINNVNIYCDIPIHYEHVPSTDKTYTLNGTGTKFSFDVSSDRNGNKAFSLVEEY